MIPSIEIPEYYEELKLLPFFKYSKVDVELLDFLCFQLQRGL